MTKEANKLRKSIKKAIEKDNKEYFVSKFNDEEDSYKGSVKKLSPTEMNYNPAKMENIFNNFFIKKKFRAKSRPGIESKKRATSI